MLNCPEHIETLVIPANDRFPKHSDEYHHYFQLKCHCGGENFSLHASNKRSLVAACGNCKREWRIYDLENYTSATKLKGEEKFTETIIPAKQAGVIFLGYEYGEIDEDEEFDRNDITWFTVFTWKDAQFKNVFEDETA